MKIGFAKYQALGNTYLVLPEPPVALTAELIRRICDVHYGLGSDGILLPEPPSLPTPEGEAAFGLRIFNPDGSEAEKSGNGLRIFARWLFDQGKVRGDEPFTLWTAGGWVRAQVSPGGSPVRVDMGHFSFYSTRIPMTGAPRLVLNEALVVGDKKLHICALTLGNPHCVVLEAPADEATARRLGPLIENHPSFPERTNVQFLSKLDRANLRIHIWERGAGYTLASGTSACAAAAAAHHLGWTAAQVTVHCPGGELLVALQPGDTVTLSGPVTPIAVGMLT